MLIRQHALESKVSRERVGVELDSMLVGSNPRSALDLMVNCGLLQCFTATSKPLLPGGVGESPGVTFPTESDLLRFGQRVVEAVSRLTAFFKDSAVHMGVPLLAKLLGDKQEAKTLLLAAVLAGYAGVKMTVKAARTDHYVRFIIKEAIKVGRVHIPCAAWCRLGHALLPAVDVSLPPHIVLSPLRLPLEQRPGREADLVVRIQTAAALFLAMGHRQRATGGLTIVGALSDPQLRVDVGNIVRDAQEAWVAGLYVLNDATWCGVHCQVFICAYAQSWFAVTPTVCSRLEWST